jgi:hypothetical protein
VRLILKIKKMKKILVLLAGMAFSSAFAQWTTDYAANTLVTNSITQSIQVTGTNDGKTWVSYWDATAGSASPILLKVQLLDSEGNQVLGSDGMFVNNTAVMSTYATANTQDVDNLGNFYIPFTATGENSTGYLHKISPTGSQLWGTSGINLGQRVLFPHVLSDGNGGAIVTWQNTTTSKMNMMKYDAAGNPAWASVKEINSPDPSNPNSGPGEMALLSDGSFVVFIHARSASPVVINSILWAQRYAADGTALWANPVQIADQFTQANRVYSVKQDGDVTYLGYTSYYVVGGVSVAEAFLQRVNTDGTLPWGINGSRFRISPYADQNFRIAFQENSDFVWGIKGVTSTPENAEYIQKFDKNTGARIFTDDAKKIFSIEDGTDYFIHVADPQLVNDKLLFLGMDTTLGAGGHMFVSYLDENGNFIWPEHYREIVTSNSVSKGTNAFFTKNVNGQSVAVWTEDKVTTGFSNVHPYAQNYILDDATLAVKDITKEKLMLYPNPANNILNISNVSAKATYAIYNVSGQLAAKGKITDGKVNISTLPTGNYLISIEDSGNITGIKFAKE